MINIRQARPDEAVRLTALIRRSKAHWGYSDEFMRRVWEDLSISPEKILSHGVYLAEINQSLAGMLHVYRRQLEQQQVLWLEDLFIDPDFMGQGIGRRLWYYALKLGQERACSLLAFESDPHAEGFYLKMGAIRSGFRQSRTIEGRSLPLMQIPISLHQGE